MDAMRIGELAEAVGVTVETVRYYERRGLLRSPSRTESGYRQYGPDDVARLEFVLRAKVLGFTLGEVSELCALSDAEATSDVADAVRAKLADIDRQLDELDATRCRLRRLIHLCDHGDGAACLQLRLAGA